MEKLFKAIYDCGVINEDSLEKLGITDLGEVERLVKEKVLERKTEILKDKPICYLRMSDLGEKHWKIGHPEKLQFYRNMNIEKMLLLSAFYCNLSESERNTWMNKDEWLLEDKQGKAVDGTYKKDKNLLGIIVLSSSSSKDIVNDVETFVKSAKIKNLNYIFY